MTVGHDDLARGLDLSRNTVTLRTRGLPHVGSVYGQRRYRLADVLPRLRNRDHEHVLVRIDLKRNDGKELFVDDDAVKRARLLKRWLKGAQIERLFSG
ncbi:hypothetical protein ANTHELSMS3_04130 [Antarctobacter heliothermus]|uniref:Uncharacterized protein n=1 Tax=Antarctobacter heliothermus TaxID=74033 RepID=A0A222E961_9RHOB|nr:hypothetical protein ANTHELSMS3_04130 [Antarctobacter heliothermus]MBT53010.1 hypothetical protein [Mameliella sp.]|tara:strand:- start:1470 stop:1763 length:294 start_codon:yes stop_codon:yes gene_type:complete